MRLIKFSAADNNEEKIIEMKMFHVCTLKQITQF